MVNADILAEKSGAAAADKVGDPHDGALPKRRIDGGIVNDANQVTQVVADHGHGLTRHVRILTANVTPYSFPKRDPRRTMQ